MKSRYRIHYHHTGMFTEDHYMKVQKRYFGFLWITVAGWMLQKNAEALVAILEKQDAA